MVSEEQARAGFLLLVMCVVVTGCHSPRCHSPQGPVASQQWQTIRAGDVFTFRAPADLKSEPVQGEDSFVGKYTSPALEVTFDYGRYSGPMNREGYTRAVTVDGKSARLVSKGDIVAIQFSEISAGNRLTMVVQLKTADAKTAEKILQSIDFP